MTTQPPLGWTTAGTVTRVLDGDTLEVEVRRTIRIRLLDCWAPEIRTASAEEKEAGENARDELIVIALGRQCVVHLPTDGDGDVKDLWTFGRALGRVYVDGVDVSATMVESGHATKTKSNRS